MVSVESLLVVVAALLAINGLLQVGSAQMVEEEGDDDEKEEEEDPVCKRRLERDFGGERPANDLVREILADVRPELEERLGRFYESMEATRFRRMTLWDGFAYIIKAKAIHLDGKEEYIHLRVFDSGKGWKPMAFRDLEEIREDLCEFTEISHFEREPRTKMRSRQIEHHDPCDPLLGGLSGVEPANDYSQELLDRWRSRIEEYLGKRFKSLEAISKRYAPGIQTLMKVKAIDENGKKTYLHVEVAPAYNEFRAAEDNHCKDDALEPIFRPG